MELALRASVRTVAWLLPNGGTESISRLRIPNILSKKVFQKCLAQDSASGYSKEDDIPVHEEP